MNLILIIDRTRTVTVRRAEVVAMTIQKWIPKIWNRLFRPIRTPLFKLLKRITIRTNPMSMMITPMIPLVTS